MDIALLNPQGHVRSKNLQIAEHPDTGGQIVYILKLAEALGELGARVHIFTRWFDDPAWPGYTSPTEAVSENVEIIRIRCGGNLFIQKERLWPHLHVWVRGIEAFLKERALRPEIMSSHYADGGLSAVMLKESLGIPFTHTGHSLGGSKMDNLRIYESNFNRYAVLFNFPLRIAAERLSFYHADAIIVSTREEKFHQYGHRVYAGAVDVDSPKIRVIPPGIDPRQFHPYTEEAATSAAYARTLVKLDGHLDGDIVDGRRKLPAVLAASRFAGKKNIVGLVEAFSSNPSLREKANLVILAGNVEKPLRPENHSSLKPVERAILDQVRAIADKTSLWGTFAICPSFGFSDEMPYLYMYAALNGWVFANVAFHEPFGLSIVEAMASGMPVVATKNGGPTDILDGGKYGLLVDPTRPEEVADALERLVVNRADWEAFSHAGIRRVTEDYTWARAAERYRGVFEEVLSRRRRGDGEFPIPHHFFRPSHRGWRELREALRALYLERGA